MKEKQAPVNSEAPVRSDAWSENLRGYQKNRPELKLYLNVSGGMPAKAYHFSFALETSGRLYCNYDVKGLKKLERTAKTEDKDLEQLINLLLTTRIFDFQQPPPRFEPDTVVGKLEIYLNDLYHVQYYAADEKQQAYHQMPTHPALYKVVDWIYARASLVLDTKKLKP